MSVTPTGPDRHPDDRDGSRTERRGGRGARAGREEVEGHLDPEIAPYVEAAAEPEEDSPAARRRAQDEALARREEEDAQALRLLAGSGLFGELEPAGDGDTGDMGDQGVLDDLDGVGESAVPDDARELTALARDSQAEARVAQIYEEIVARAPEHDVQPTLDRVHAVLELLGEPQRAAPVIHVAGTNGKTSTARAIETLLGARGLRTGRFTSPHLHTVRERIAIDGEPISREAFVAAWEDVAPVVALVDERSQAAGGPRLSFFEVFTVMAFAAFADAPVDVVVLEVGMGGRWDATNVADAQVAVVTPISFDHTRWLGETLEEIAGEKAGVVKDGATLVLAAQEPQVEAVLREAAAARRAHVIAEGPDLEVTDRQLVVGGQLVGLRTPAARYEDVIVPLHGEHQAHNALLALGAVEAFFGGGALDPAVVETAMSGVSSPGRLEVVRSSPLVLVDSAHNPAGAAALRRAVDETFALRHAVGVFGAMADKDHESILAELEPLLAEIVVTGVPTMRGADVEELAEVARSVFGADRVQVREDLAEAIDVAAALAESAGGSGREAMTHETASGQVMASAGVVVCGSVVLAAHARALLGRAG